MDEVGGSNPPGPTKTTSPASGGVFCFGRGRFGEEPLFEKLRSNLDGGAQRPRPVGGVTGQSPLRSIRRIRWYD